MFDVNVRISTEVESTVKTSGEPTRPRSSCPKEGHIYTCGIRAYVHQIRQSGSCPKYTPPLSPTLTAPRDPESRAWRRLNKGRQFMITKPGVTCLSYERSVFSPGIFWKIRWFRCSILLIPKRFLFHTLFDLLPPRNRFNSRP